MEHVNHMAHSYLHHGYDHGRHDSHLDELIQANHVSQGHQSLGEQIHTASINGMKETSDAARDTVDAVRDATDATNQIGNINLQSTERNGGETRSTAERTAGFIKDHISSVANQASRDHTRLISEICDIRKEMSDGFGETKIEALKGHHELSKGQGDIKLEACKNHSETARLIEAKAAEQARLSERLAAEAARQLADCCCRLEGEHATTRALIASQALDECRRREGALANENSFLKLQASLASNGPGNS